MNHVWHIDEFYSARAQIFMGGRNISHAQVENGFRGGGACSSVNISRVPPQLKNASLPKVYR